MKKGFTLAEVLITLGIIGVVAALTLPNLLQNYQKKVFDTQLQRTINLISNSAVHLMSDENAPTLADTYLVAVDNDYKNAQGKFMNKYFKVARDCGTENFTKCLGETYFSSDRTESQTAGELFNTEGLYCVTVNTGATVCMTSMSSNGINDEGDFDYGKSRIVIDVNGPSNPNEIGHDLYQFNLYSDERLSDYIASTEDSEDTDLSDSSGSSDDDISDTPLISENKPELFSDTAQKIGDYWVDVKSGGSNLIVDCSNTSSDDYKYCEGITTSDGTWGYRAGVTKACEAQGGRVPTKAELLEIKQNSNGSLKDVYSDKTYGFTMASDMGHFFDCSSNKVGQCYNGRSVGMLTEGWDNAVFAGAYGDIMCIK